MNITKEEVTEYIYSLYSPINEDLEWLRGVCERREVPTILRDTERFLVTQLNLLKPLSILEVGTALGYSSCVMATTLPDAHITTIEKYDRSYYDAKEAIERLKLTDHITQYMGDGTEVMQDLVKEGNVYDFIFIDAAKSHYGEFFAEAMKMAHKGTAIVCDNVLLKAAVADETMDKRKRFRTSIDRMQAFLEEISNDDRVETAILSVGDGISISYVK